jgi:hypothetical protein
MNLVGAGGKGESVWLAFFLIAVLTRFAPLAARRGDAAFAETCERGAQPRRARRGDELGRRLVPARVLRRRHAARLATNASAASIRSRRAGRCISGAAPDGARGARWSRSTAARPCRRRLVQLLDPPFDTRDRRPATSRATFPACAENGGQYTHARVWAALAFAALGDGERAVGLFGLLAPLHHGASASDIATYRIEPYVVAGDVYASKRARGRGGWTGTPARRAGCTSCSSKRCSASSGAGTNFACGRSYREAWPASSSTTVTAPRPSASPVRGRCRRAEPVDVDGVVGRRLVHARRRRRRSRGRGRRRRDVPTAPEPSHARRTECSSQ